MYIRLETISNEYFADVYTGYSDCESVLETHYNDSGSKDQYITNIVRIKLTLEQFTELNSNKKSLELGIAYGFDTKKITPEQLKHIGYRSNNHPALWGFYLTETGQSYRSHTSSHELRSMIVEYETEQRELEILDKNNFFEISDSDLIHKLEIIISNNN